MTKKIRMLVADDHRFVAYATQKLFEKFPEFDIVDVAFSGQESLELVEKHQPDLVLLDFLLPDMTGSEVVRQIKSRYPHIHVVIFTGEDVKDLITVFLEARVSGIVSKGTKESTIVNMIHCMLDGHIVLPYDTYMHSLSLRRPVFEESSLTEQDIAIMNMVVKGATHEQIAERIHVSRRSIDNYLRKIYEKLGAATKLQAVEKFIHTSQYKDSTTSDS